MREIYHHGILGQKWGVRRFQNEDGTLTEEGRTRYKGASRPLILMDAVNTIGNITVKDINTKDIQKVLKELKII